VMIYILQSETGEKNTDYSSHYNNIILWIYYYIVLAEINEHCFMFRIYDGVSIFIYDGVYL